MSQARNTPPLRGDALEHVPTLTMWEVCARACVWHTGRGEKKKQKNPEIIHLSGAKGGRRGPS